MPNERSELIPRAGEWRGILKERALFMFKFLFSFSLLFLYSNYSKAYSQGKDVVTVATEVKQERKYGIIDIQAVILNVEEGKKARSDLEKEIKGKEGELKKKRDELEKLNQDWQKQAALLSESARMQKQQEFQEKFLSLRNSEMEFQNEIKKKEQQATQNIAHKVAMMVEKRSKEMGLEVVFESNSAGLLYLKDPVDLTPDIVKNYEAEQKTAKADDKAKKDKK